MDFYPLISEFFQRHLNAASMMIDDMAEPLGVAAVMSSEAVLNECKLFSVGIGADCASATAFAALLHRGILRERPGLPVVELSEHHVESAEAGVSWASQQIQALGQPGDVAIIFGAALNEQDSQRIGHAADQRQVKVIWLGRRGPGISVDAAEEQLETRVTLNATLAVCLARLIDIHTFGPMED